MSNRKEKREKEIEFCKRLETVALGCHLKINDSITNLLKTYSIETYQCVEFILNKPLHKKSEIDNDVKLYYPFLFRLINAQPFIYKFGKHKISYHVKTIAKTKPELQKLKNTIRKPSLLQGHSLAENAFNVWAKKKKDENNKPYARKNLLSKGIKENIEKGIYNTRVISNNYLIAPWFLNISNKPLNLIQIPIATKVTFWGYFLIAYQYKDNTKSKKKELQTKIKEKLREIIEALYIPTLTLFHISNWEKEIDDKIKDSKKSRENGSLSQKSKNDDKYFEKIKSTVLEEIKKQFPLSCWFKNGSNELNKMESAFSDIWKWREKILTNNGNRYQDDQDKIKTLESQLYFHKYNIASLGMLNVIDNLISNAKQMTPNENGKSLPAALVYGEAGSGKDVMARLIPLFSEKYNSKKIETINMAALKPDSLAVPLLFGVKNLDNPKINIDGLISNPNIDPDSVIILDELNSLDHDLQGSLLRVLENGEVRSLFSHKTESVKNLVIGIVNEDPEVVCRETELRELKSAEAFLGKVISSYLYNNFYNVKKLRPDLMYRLKRGLYIRIPPLCERREDIPILFNVNLSAALNVLGNNKSSGSFEVEMDAFELMMRKDIAWPGNIRQLEAVSKDIAKEAFDQNEKSNKNSIDSNIVEKVLRKHYLIS